MGREQTKKYSDEQLTEMWTSARKKISRVPMVKEFQGLGLPDINYYNRAYGNYTTFLKQQGEVVAEVIYRRKNNIKRYFKPDEWLRFTSIISDYDMRFWLEFLLHTGMRYDEAASVHVADVDFINRRISILNPKGGNKKIREIMVSTFLIGRIQNYAQVKKLNINSTFLFPTNADLNYNIKKYAKLIGVTDFQDLSCHNLRKTLIQWCCALNVNSSILSHFMGHNVSTETQFYASAALFNQQEKSLIRSILDDLFI